MSNFNVPADWANYYSRCETCGDKTHASERYACSCDDNEEGEVTFDGLLINDKGEVVYRKVMTYGDEEVVVEESVRRYSDDQCARYLTPAMNAERVAKRAKYLER
jgi:hypothetical protein